MWKRGGRSSALDRAQALLSAKRNSRGTESTLGSTQGSTATTRPRAGAVDGAIKNRSAPPNGHTLLSDLSGLSSVSSAAENGADTVRSAAPEKCEGREQGHTKDLRPQSSLGGGGGSRFLKKAPPPATDSSQSPLKTSQVQPMPEPRYVSASQAAAMNRLAQIESRIRSHNQAQEPARRGISPPPVPSESSSEQSLKGRRFLKNKAAVPGYSSKTATASGSSKGPDVGAGSSSRVSGNVVPSLRAVSGVSLESDEEDMRRLLGDSFDSADSSLLGPGRPSSMRTADKTREVHCTPPPAALCPSPPRSPPSPPRRTSPFRFTGQARARFSPSALSPSPSPPRRPSSPGGTGSPPRSLSSVSGRSEVLSLEELFPVGPGSEEPDSETGSVLSEDFKINVMTLDDLVPATFGFMEETPGEEREGRHNPPAPGSLRRHQQLPGLREEKEEEQQEDVVDYQSDFESVSRTEPNYSDRQVSEHLQGGGDEAGEEALNPDVSCESADEDYSSTFSDVTSQASEGSRTSESFSRSRSFSRTSNQRPRRRASPRKALKEAAVQTQPETTESKWSAGMATFQPPLGITYMNPSPVAAHTLSADRVEALSTFNPAVFVLNDILKQQLATTRRFIQNSRRLHSSLVQSLEPPNYRYTTLEDTREYIRRRRPPKLTMQEALEEVQREMRDYQCM